MRAVVLLLMIACRREPDPPEPPTCFRRCYRECTEPMRSELVPCAKICDDRCSCQWTTDACTCALVIGATMPVGCTFTTPSLSFVDAGLDAPVEDAPDL